MNLQPIFLELVLTTYKKEQEKWEQYIQKLQQKKGNHFIVLAKESDVGQNNWARALLKQEDIPCYYGKCQSSDQILFAPYHAFYQAFPDFFQKFSEDNRKKFAEIGNNLSSPKLHESKSKRDACGDTVENLEFEQTNYLYTEFSRYLSQFPTPFIIYIEDIHRADLSTLEMWKFLVAGLVNQPILLVATGSRDTSDTPELPSHLRGSKVPILQQLKAIQFTTKSRTFTKQERLLLQEIYRESSIIELSKVPWIELMALLKNIFSSKVSEIFLEMLGEKSQHHPFYLGQILAYLSDVVTLDGESLALKFAENDIDIPRDMEEIFLSNLGKLSTSTLKALEYAALSSIPIEKNLWQMTCEYSDDVWERIWKETQSENVLELTPDKKKLIFSNEKIRQILIKQISNPRQKAIHFAWSEVAKEVGLPHYVYIYHAQKGPEPEAILYDLFDGGTYSESLLYPLSGYEFYKEGAKLFPEIREAFSKEIKKIMDMIFQTSEKKSSSSAQETSGEEQEDQEKQADSQQEKGFSAWIEKKVSGFYAKEKDELIQKILEIIRLYRLANFEGQPIFSEPLQNFLHKKLLYWRTPKDFLPGFWSLLRYLVRVAAENEKIYPKEDILALWKFVSFSLVPPKDFSTQRILRQFAQRCNLPVDSTNQEIEFYLSVAKQEKNISKKAELTLNAGFFARQSKQFLQAVEIFFQNVQFCGKHLQAPDIPYWEAESLRHLAISYQLWAKSLSDESMYEKAQQSAYAYSDAANCYTRLQEASWIAGRLQQQAMKIAKNYEFEEEEFQSAQQTATNKYELAKEQQEYHHGKGLILCDEDDLGCIDFLENLFRQENIEPNIEVAPTSLDETRWSKDYENSVWLINSYSKMWAQEYPKIIAQSSGCEGKNETPESGWFVFETGHHTKIVFTATAPGQMYRLVRDCVQQKILTKYL